MNPSHSIWFDRPARSWYETLLLGNGRIGAAAFGGVDEDRYTLNEDSLWSGHPGYKEPDFPEDSFERLRKLGHEHRFKEAAKLAEETLCNSMTQNYLPLGELLMSFPAGSPVTDYRRELDMTRAVLTTSYTRDGVTYTREAFISHPAEVMVLRFTATEPGSVSFAARLDSVLRHEVLAEGTALTLSGDCPELVVAPKVNQGYAVHEYHDEPERRGIPFFAKLCPVVTGGTVTTENGEIRVENADEALLLFAARTGFIAWNVYPGKEVCPYAEPCREDIEKAITLGYDALLKAHLDDYKPLYDRCELDLGGGEEGLLPTYARLNRHAEGVEDPALYALLFHFGRYLTIAGSRKGTQAMNLQGIWNHREYPPWLCNYTININTEMNYWPTLSTNLAECQEPLHRLVEELCESGRRTARDYYHAPGFCSHHNTDLWRISTPMGNHQAGCCVWGMWPMSSGWLLRSLIEYYNYTEDREFLTGTLYPLLSECSDFYAAVLSEDGEGKLVFCPSTSPENEHLEADGSECPIAETTEMTMAVIRDTFMEVLRFSEILGIRDDRTEKLTGLLPRLRTTGVTRTGAVSEWYPEQEQAEINHRHTSQLYALHPAHLIRWDDPLADACRRSLLERGDNGTGWSLGWKINHWARLHDGDHALLMLDMQLDPVSGDDEMNYDYHHGGTYPNMLDAHPPFQIDGNFGACAAIVEMLLENTPDGIQLLPALPSSWKKGSVRGLRAWGNKTVSFSWENGEVTESVIE